MSLLVIIKRGGNIVDKLLYTIGELLMTECEEVDNVSYTADGIMVIAMCDGASYALTLNDNG